MPRDKGDGGPAFPNRGDNSPECSYYDGMSLRDYAIIKFLSAQIQYEGMEGSNVKLNVAMAHEYFDAMLSAREEKGDA